MLAESFPLYAIRKHDSIEEEEGMRLVVSRGKTWVLDVPGLGGNYLSRRLQILASPRKYPIYPLYNRIDSYRQLIDSRSSLIIDAEGQLHRYRKRKFYKIKCERIIRSRELSSTVGLIWLQESGGPFKVKNWWGQEYAKVFHIGAFREVWELHTEPFKDTARKL